MVGHRQTQRAKPTGKLLWRAGSGRRGDDSEFVLASPRKASWRKLTLREEELVSRQLRQRIEARQKG